MAAGAGGKTRASFDAGVEEKFSSTQWLGSPSSEAPLLRIRVLRYPWLRRARTGVTVVYVASRAWLRPDLARIFAVCIAGGLEEASSVLHRLITKGGRSGYQLPDELPGDCNFAYSAARVH